MRQVESFGAELDEAHAKMKEKINSITKQCQMNCYKMQKYDKLYRDTVKELSVLSRQYLKISQTKEGDFKRILEAEFKYKQAYYNYEDLRVKRMEKWTAAMDTKAALTDLHHEIKQKCAELLN